MFNAMTDKRCLVLNKCWTPIQAVSLQRAITMLFSIYKDGEPKAKIIDHTDFQAYTWEDWSKLKPEMTDEKISAGNMYFKIPEVIMLTKYEKMPKPKAHFSRRTLYKRDNLTCQYCGVRPGTPELTIDHVVPRSQGGQTTWENCCLACVECNSYKADRTPDQAGMRLRTIPKKPKAQMFRYETKKPIKSWESFLGTAYWEVEIENDNG
jgi:hypothetical protein